MSVDFTQHEPRVSSCCGVVIFQDQWDEYRPKCSKCKKECPREPVRDFKQEAGVSDGEN